VHRVVLDLNVVISALIEARGPSGRVVDAVLEGRLDAAACPRWFAQLAAVAERPKFSGRFSREEALATIDALLAVVEMRDDPEAATTFTPDRGDDYLVALALEAGCDAIVSGDRHLRAQDAVPVVSSSVLAEQLEAGL
jgi:putative PIN family toxin of toxin-antitoxin system